MCGVFGYLGDYPDPLLHRQAVALAARRGPDGHGWVTWHPELSVVRSLGPLDPALVPATTTLGHARLATVGQRRRDLAGVQPVVVDRHVLVHNGNVPNWPDLEPGAPSDSWAIGYAYARARTREAPAAALASVTDRCDTPTGVVVVADRDGPWLVWRRGRLPLYRLTVPGGVYLSSGELAGSTLVPEGVSEITRPQVRVP